MTRTGPAPISSFALRSFRITFFPLSPHTPSPPTKSMKISLATALSLTALAGSAQANWFHKDPKRQSAYPRS